MAAQYQNERLALLVLRRDGARIRVEALIDCPVADGRLLRREWRAQGRQLSVLLPSGRYVVLQAEAPAVPRAEWRDALRWKLKDMIEWPVEQTLFDVAEIPVEAYAPGRQTQCFVMAAQREQVATLVAPLLAAKVEVAAVDIPEMALRNIAALFAEPHRGIALLAFDEGGAQLIIVFEGELYSTRRIDVAPVALAQADEFRRQQLLERVALETQRTLDAFDRQYSFMTVNRLMLAAPPELQGLQEALAANLYIPVAPLDLTSVMDFTAVPALADPALQIRHLALLGAALRDGEAA